MTAEGLLELELELSEELLESSEEPVVLPEDVVVSSDEVVVSSDDVVAPSDEVVVLSDELVGLSDEPVVCDGEASPFEDEPLPEDEPVMAVTRVAEAVVALLVVPMEPSNAMAPNASAKIASDAATTRLRMRAIRAARARSFSRASCFGEGVWSGMVGTVGGRAESGPGRTREPPGGAVASRAADAPSGRARALARPAASPIAAA